MIYIFDGYAFSRFEVSLRSEKLAPKLQNTINASCTVGLKLVKLEEQMFQF